MTHEEIKSITSLIDARIAKIKELDLDNMDMQTRIQVQAVLIAFYTCKEDILEYFINRVKEQGYFA